MLIGAIIFNKVKTFTEWLDNELTKRGWTRADLARRGDINQSTLSMIYSQQRSPGEKTCRKIARAFNIRQEYVFRKAGLLDKKEEEDPPDLEELKNLYIVASKEVQRDILEYARFKSYRRDRP